MNDFIFPRGDDILAYMREITPEDKGNSRYTSAEIINGIGWLQIDYVRCQLASQDHWPGNLAAIVRKNPLPLEKHVSFLTNCDVIAALHGIALGIDPAVAVALAYRDLLVFGELHTEGEALDPEIYRVLATVVESGETRPSIAIYAHKDAAKYEMEWDADECILFHEMAGGEDIALMSRDFWVRYPRSTDMIYDEVGEVYYRYDTPLPDSPSEWAAARKAAMEEAPFDLNGQPDPRVRAAYFGADGSTTLFSYAETIAVAGLCRMGVPPGYAASIVGEGKALACKLGPVDSSIATLLVDGDFDPVEVLTVGNDQWVIIMDDLSQYSPDPRYNAWALRRNGAPMDLLPGKKDPTRRMKGRIKYQSFASKFGGKPKVPAQAKFSPSPSGLM